MKRLLCVILAMFAVTMTACEEKPEEKESTGTVLEMDFTSGAFHSNKFEVLDVVKDGLHLYFSESELDKLELVGYNGVECIVSIADDEAKSFLVRMDDGGGYSINRIHLEEAYDTTVMIPAEEGDEQLSFWALSQKAYSQATDEIKEEIVDMAKDRLTLENYPEAKQETIDQFKAELSKLEPDRQWIILSDEETVYDILITGNVPIVKE